MNWRMNRLWKTVAMAFLLTLPSFFCQAAPLTMGVEEIQPGMHGIGKTVIQGQTLETFGVEVLGILKNKGPVGDLILIRVSGDLVERTGGIAQGMSGSPVYIDGRLVGAVAYGWSLTDHKIGMVTPIGDMLKLWAEEVPHPVTVSSDQEEKKLKEEDKKESSEPGVEVALPENQEKKQESNQETESGSLKVLSTPVMASGFGEYSLKWLAGQLKPWNLVPYGVGSSGGEGVATPLEPGSAVGVELVRGDLSIAALGTVTYVEGDKVLAFGHPFLKKGNVSYCMTNADMITTVPGLENSFKVGTVGPMLGVIQQDRGAGIAGVTGKIPSLIPMQVMVQDKDRHIQQVHGVQMIRDEMLTPVLATATTLNLMEKTSDRIGAGTAKVRFEVAAPGMLDKPLVRENMFYSPTNIGETAIAELFEGMLILATNTYKQVDVWDVNVSVQVEEARKTATIMQAKPLVSEVKPGDKLGIEIKLKPFRGEMITKVMNITVPKNQKPGPLTFEVRGGGMIPLSQLLKSQLQEEGQPLKLELKPKHKSLTEQLQTFVDRDRNNDVVVEIVDMEMRNPAGGEGKGAPGAGKGGTDGAMNSEGVQPKKPLPKETPKTGENPADKKKAAAGKYHLSTDYIIDGLTQMVVQVAGEKNN